MSLLFQDSFDHYTTLTHKGWTVVGGSPAISAGNGRFSTASLRCNGSSAAAMMTFPATDTIIVGVAARFDTPATNQFYIAAFRDGGTNQLTVVTNTARQIEVRRGGFSGTLLGSPSVLLVSVDVFHHFEVKAVIHGSTGSVTVKVDGVTYLTLTSQNTQASGAAQVTGCIFGAVNSGLADYDDVIIMDDAGSDMNDFIGDKRVIAAFPVAEGNYSDFTPSTGSNNAALVDEAAPNDDTDYVESANPGDQDTYTNGGISQTVANINAVCVLHRARKTDAGTREIQALIRSDTTDANGPTHVLASSYAYYNSVFYENPDGSVAWTPTAVNDLEIGTEVVT